MLHALGRQLLGVQFHQGMTGVIVYRQPRDSELVEDGAQHFAGHRLLKFMGQPVGQPFHQLVIYAIGIKSGVLDVFASEVEDGELLVQRSHWELKLMDNGPVLHGWRYSSKPGTGFRQRW